MDQNQNNKFGLKILKTSLIFVFLSSFGVCALGFSVQKIHLENQSINSFLDIAKNAQPDFEKSLSMYTENTQKDIDYIDDLRPSGEMAYIDFLSKLEDLAQAGGFVIDISTISDSGSVDDTGSKYLDYEVDFYGSEEQLMQFLYGIQELPYFVRVLSFDYTSLDGVLDKKEFDLPNVILTIRLYVK